MVQDAEEDTQRRVPTKMLTKLKKQIPLQSIGFFL